MLYFRQSSLEQHYHSYHRPTSTSLASGVGAIRDELKLPCSKNVKGKRYLMNERIKFQYSTAFLLSFSLHSGLNKSSIPPDITLRSSFFNTHGLRRSQNNADEGPRDPTKLGNVDWTQKWGTNLVKQFGHSVLYSCAFPATQPFTTSSSLR